MYIILFWFALIIIVPLLVISWPLPVFVLGALFIWFFIRVYKVIKKGQ